jgi:hypothetical protein
MNYVLLVLHCTFGLNDCQPYYGGAFETLAECNLAMFETLTAPTPSGIFVGCWDERIYARLELPE